MPETKTEVLARLLMNGGTLLCVGGNISQYLPERIRNHAQIRCWDDERQDWIHKTVPSNTRAILISRWVGHPQVWKLRSEADALKIPVFFPLRSREMKDIVQEALSIETARVVEHIPASMEREETTPQTEPMTQAANMDTAVEAAGAMVEMRELEKGFLTKDEVMRKPNRGEIQQFVRRHANPEAKSMMEEGRRLFALLKAEGISSTVETVQNCIYQERKKGMLGKPVTPRVAVIPKSRAKQQASHTGPQGEVELLAMLNEGERLLNDAKSAMDLLAEFMPKLKAAVEKHYSGMAKLREFLGV